MAVASISSARGGVQSPLRELHQLLNHPGGMTFLGLDDAVLLTPALARVLLGLNTHNRYPDKGQIGRLAGAMERGEWEFNGDAIRLSYADGVWRMDDGQHRCYAVIRSGVSIPQLFVIVSPEAQDGTDDNRKRTFGDALSIDKEYKANILAACVNHLWAYEADGVPVGQQRRTGATVAQKREVFSRHPGIRDSLEYVGVGTHATRSFAATHHYLFWTVGGDRNVADEFFRLYKSGADLHEGHPILALKRREEKERAATSQMPSRLRSRFWITAWNAWVSERPIHKLTYRPGSPFPKIERVNT